MDHLVVEGAKIGRKAQLPGQALGESGYRRRVTLGVAHPLRGAAFGQLGHERLQPLFQHIKLPGDLVHVGAVISEAHQGVKGGAVGIDGFGNLALQVEGLLQPGLKDPVVLGLPGLFPLLHTLRLDEAVLPL